MAEAIRFFELNNGAKIPSVGLGSWKADPGALAETITAAIRAGYRHIDCAQRYGNEKQIGDTLKKLLEEGVVKREDIWITSKPWCTDHAPEDVPLALNRTLSDLQLDYVDLYLMHWPVSMKKGSVGLEPENLTKADIPSTWRAMEAICNAGKARAIGASNFSCKKLADLLEVARIPPAVNQGYAPLGSSGKTGLKTEVLKNPILNLIAEKLGKTPAQVSLRWGLQMGHSVLPKSTNEMRIKENFHVFDWQIPEELCAQFSEIEHARLVTGSTFVHETYGSYKTIEELWDGEI